jgi:predicted phosphodiesterase
LSLKNVIADLKDKSVDLTIFLGDLLTYGVQPVGVLEQIFEYKNSNPSVFIKGNHDQIYFDIHTNLNFEYKKFPDFVKESIDWTLGKIGNIDLYSLFDWKEDYILKNIYLAHANPFKYSDWRYLNDLDLVHAAFSEINKKNCSVGVFGHSHKQKLLKQDSNFYISSLTNLNYSISYNQSYIFNAGSAGQPRGKSLCYLLLCFNANNMNAFFKSFRFDLTESISMISHTSLSTTTKEILISYLRSYL